MRAFVFTDPALTSQAGRFVWLELNTDLTANEPALQKHEADALPTFLVIDPKDEKVVLRWVGSFTVAQAEAFLAEAYEKAKGSAEPASAADAALDRADRLYGKRQYAEAAAAYREALTAAVPGWPREARAVEALLYSLQSTEAWPQALALARERLPHLAGTPSALIVATSGLDSALELPEQDPGRAAAIAALEAELRAALADRRVNAAADDRSSAYSSLVAARKSSGDASGARRVAGEWVAFLEAEAVRATSPEQRAVYDSHRMSAYLELGQPEKAVAMLSASERDLPRDYNPPNRLARVYAARGQWRQALAASARAETLAPGRARLRVLATRAELLQQKGDTAAARRTYDQAIAFGEALPAEERPARQIEQLRKQRARLAPSP
jgi:tetratricopeptide (TPR) repeat protein